MATPEISHHCALCGATIRRNVNSCPHCGSLDEVRAAPVSNWLLQPELAVMPAEILTAPPLGLAPAPPPVAALPSVPDAPRYEARRPAASLSAPVLVQAELPENVPAPPRYEPANYAPQVAAPPDTPAEMPPLPTLAKEDAEPPTEKSRTASAPDASGPSQSVSAGGKSLPPVTVLTPPRPPTRRRRSTRPRYGPPTLKERLIAPALAMRDMFFGLSRHVAPTVTQVRRTSNTMLDRASDDPSTRFAVISALLIIIAALVWAFSFFLG